MNGLFVFKKIVIICYELETVFMKLGNGTSFEWCNLECIFIIGLLINLNFWCYSSDLSGIEIDKKLGFDPEHIPEPIKTKKNELYRFVYNSSRRKGEILLWNFK